jgi:hypothetical protein
MASPRQVQCRREVLLPSGESERCDKQGAGTAGRLASTPPSSLTVCRVRFGDGWPSLVRAVDAPAVQDVPAWDGTTGLAYWWS